MFGNMFSTDIGMDLGTCNTLVYIKGKGLVINEPSVVAIEKNTKRVISVGKEAKNMLLRTPTDIVAIRPLRDGVIADIETTEKMIRHFIAMGLPRRWLVKPRMVIGIPVRISVMRNLFNFSLFVMIYAMSPMDSKENSLTLFSPVFSSESFLSFPSRSTISFFSCPSC